MHGIGAMSREQLAAQTAALKEELVGVEARLVAATEQGLDGIVASLKRRVGEIKAEIEIYGKAAKKASAEGSE